MENLDSNFGLLAFDNPAREGVSDWLTVPQDMITAFGVNTLDLDPMHIDPEWAQRHSPFGGTIAFGFLTMSLLTHLLNDAMTRTSEQARETSRIHGHYLNYGFDRLRLVSPVPVDAKLRGRFVQEEARVDDRGRQIICFDSRIEIEGVDRPALVAKWLAIWIPGTPR